MPSIRLYIVRSLKMYSRVLVFWRLIMMKRIILWIFNYFEKTEIVLWSCSVLAILASFFITDRENYLTPAASLIGVTSLIFNAKGNPFGQVLMIIFSVMYGIISFCFSYYGEMITYLGMTAPMAVVALISWLKNPYRGNKAEVRVNRIKKKEHILIWLLALLVTVIFYHILVYFKTANIIPSTLSVTTSFLAVYLTFRRSPYYAIGYAANDIVLIVLWILASLENRAYISVAVCFLTFLANDIYGFLNWRKMGKKGRQKLIQFLKEFNLIKINRHYAQKTHS